MGASKHALAVMRLARTPRVGPVTFRGLVSRFGSAEKALEALPDLARRAGGKPPKPPSIASITAEIETLETAGCSLLTLGEANYPKALAALEDAPPVLTARGALSLLSEPMLAMVGARNASTIGRKLAMQLARDLGKNGMVIASGLARGIDTAAHMGSLHTGTVAVLAGGINRIYPKENDDLYWQIAEQGLILAEMPWDAQPTAQLFPRRNRIVSGLSLGVIVVEAAKRSGSLITARLAGEQGRQVFAVPGNPLDPRASGANHLIREGATLVRSAEDVLEDIGPMTTSIEGPAQSFSNTQVTAEPDAALRQAVLDTLSTVPIHMDEIARSLQVSAPLLNAAFVELELAGRLERHAGGRIALAAG